jgi:WD40 repeat protein
LILDIQDEGRIFKGFFGAVFSPDGSHLATYGTGGVWVYETATGRLLVQKEGKYSANAIFSADSHLLSIGLYGGLDTPAVIDANTGSAVISREGISANNAFSPDGRWLGTIHYGYEDPSRFDLIDLASQQMVRSVTFESGVELSALAFSPDPRLAAVADEYGKIYLVDLNAMQVAATLTGTQGRVEALAFSADGRYLASSGADGVVRIWGLP